MRYLKPIHSMRDGLLIGSRNLKVRSSRKIHLGHVSTYLVFATLHETKQELQKRKSSCKLLR